MTMVYNYSWLISPWLFYQQLFVVVSTKNIGFWNQIFLSTPKARLVSDLVLLVCTSDLVFPELHKFFCDIQTCRLNCHDIMKGETSWKKCFWLTRDCNPSSNSVKEKNVFFLKCCFLIFDVKTQITQVLSQNKYQLSRCSHKKISK